MTERRVPPREFFDRVSETQFFLASDPERPVSREEWEAEIAKVRAKTRADMDAQTVSEFQRRLHRHNKQLLLHLQVWSLLRNDMNGVLDPSLQMYLRINAAVLNVDRKLIVEEFKSVKLTRTTKGDV